MATLVAPPRKKASELEIMFPDRVLTIRHRRVVVREARMLEWARDCYPVALPIIGRLTPLSGDADLLTTIELEHDAWRELCVLLTDIDAVHDDEFAQLAVAVAAINAHLLIPREDSTKPQYRRARLADMYAKLASSGFGSPVDVQEKYTERQIVMYYESAIRVEKFDRALHLLDVNRAMAGGKDADKYVKELTSGR